MLHVTGLRSELLATVILAGQTEFDDRTNKARTEALITRGLLDIVRGEASQEKRRSEGEESRTSKSDIINPINDISPDLPPLSSKEIGTIVVEKERPAALTTIALRWKLKRSLELQGERLWDGVDVQKVAKAIIDIGEGSDDSQDIFSKSSPTPFTTALARIVRTYSQRPAAERKVLLIRNSTFTHKLSDDIRVLLETQVDFVNTVLIPVILMLVVTASVFYDAYQSRGDSDAARSLAYGLLYSWLIILAVAANCYTSSLTYGLVNRTIRTKAKVLPLSPVTVRLHLRYTNALRWFRWAW